jgi:hypothetical protein
MLVPLIHSMDLVSIGSDSYMTFTPTLGAGEQDATTGASAGPSTAINLGKNPSTNGPTTIGLFYTVPIPATATIISASIQFIATASSSGSITLALTGNKVANATQPNSAVSFDLKNRVRTSARVLWAPANWIVTAGSKQAGPEQLTPDLKSIFQEIVSLPSWVSGNRMLMIVEENPPASGNARVASLDDGTTLVVTYSGKSCPRDFVVLSRFRLETCYQSCPLLSFV